MFLVFKQDENIFDQLEMPELSAHEISKVLSVFGDVYVVKDSKNTCFAEFQHYDEMKLTHCSGGGVEEIREILFHENLFEGKLLGAYNYYESIQIRKTLAI